MDTILLAAAFAFIAVNNVLLVFRLRRIDRRMDALEDLVRVRSCRVCGCTDDRACIGGCWWVAEDLCSACATVDMNADEA